MALVRTYSAEEWIARFGAGRKRTAVTIGNFDGVHCGHQDILQRTVERAGKTDAAGKAYSEFEQEALREQNLADNANRELAAYYTDYARQPAKALEIATAELARRHDAFTLDAHAWALAACGDYVQAAAEMAKALAFGIRDPEILRHKSEIAKHQPADASR